MRLTTFTDYSLRVLVYLAEAPEGRSTIAAIARAYGISEHHLVKVAHALGRKGFLKNTRGRRGGLRLGRRPEDINLGDVVRFTESTDMPAECFNRSTNTCMLSGGCRLQSVFREATAVFYETLGRYSLADLRVAPRKLEHLLRFEARVSRSPSSAPARENH